MSKHRIFCSHSLWSRASYSLCLLYSMHWTFCTGVTSRYQNPLFWTFPKVLLTSIYELFILYQPCSKGSDLHQDPHVCVIPWVSSELVQGLLSFAHMILLVMWLHFQWPQMSLSSLCLLSVRSLMLRTLTCILLHFGSCRSIWKILRTSLQVSIPHPRHHSSWNGTLLPFFFLVTSS